MDVASFSEPIFVENLVNVLFSGWLIFRLRWSKFIFSKFFYAAFQFHYLPSTQERTTQKRRQRFSLSLSFHSAVCSAINPVVFQFISDTLLARFRFEWNWSELRKTLRKILTSPFHIGKMDCSCIIFLGKSPYIFATDSAQMICLE